MTATVIVTLNGRKDTEMLTMYIRLSAVCGAGRPIRPADHAGTIVPCPQKVNAAGATAEIASANDISRVVTLSYEIRNRLGTLALVLRAAGILPARE